MSVLPAITPKLYTEIVNEIVRLKVGEERSRLQVLQRQLSEAQQTMAAAKTLSEWTKAG